MLFHNLNSFAVPDPLYRINRPGQIIPGQDEKKKKDALTSLKWKQKRFGSFPRVRSGLFGRVAQRLSLIHIFFIP